ncbi:hypothetical protein [Burkholderia sp. Ax-1719]|uniref:hypothetical protein n=1 Tax=Burkholderia sp. Ax-1719 TaxID=2608334 RepID=UPI00142395CC|nr:hypothetical protein [Burkholderia sp. Ax-1719]NIE64156.1 hypothetical protein [Burkholderia sp. Ax-1719]
MNPVTFGQCVKGAWRDGLRYVKAQPVLLLIFCVLAWLTFFAETALVPVDVPPFRLLAYVPYSVFELAKMAVFSTLTIQVTRFALLGASASNGPLLSRPFWRYLGLNSALIVSFLIVTACAVALAYGLLLVLARHHVLAPLFVPLMLGGGGAIAACAMIFVYFRLSLLFTHVAVGRELQFRAAWIDTRGHCWSILLTQMVVTCPPSILMWFLSITAGPARQHGWGSVEAALNGAVWVIMLCVGGTCSAWLYRRYAGALLDYSATAVSGG